MNGVSHAELVAAVSNAGGMGVVGGLTMTPKYLKGQIDEIKALLKDKDTPFGVDLAIPQIGGSARKTNHDYTHGKVRLIIPSRVGTHTFCFRMYVRPPPPPPQYVFTSSFFPPLSCTHLQLPELIDVIINEGASIFVCAVGIPPRWAVDKLHAAGIPVMNMIGHPKHVKKALDAGVDILCAQGGEGGGHTGEIASTVLIPQIVDLCKGKTSPLNGGPIHVIAAGGMFDGRGLVAALSWGAQGVWVGTRFVAATESACPPRHQKALVAAESTDVMKTLIYSGRPLHTLVTDHVKMWEGPRKAEMQELLGKGVVPFEHQAQNDDDFNIAKAMPLLMGQACGAIKSVETADDIVQQMMTQAIDILKRDSAKISKL
jgi:NAD(P)H-dependent flavin oxidoreductase YrpB (nitropropane dioxygenase family)